MSEARGQYRTPICQGPNWKPRHSPREPGTCGACGKPLVGRNRWFCPSPYGKARSPGESCRATYAVNHFWEVARAEALRRADWTCRVCRRRGEPDVDPSIGLEVNHIVPRNGGGYHTGCHHHQDNLAVLCHDCHLGVTAAQRGYYQEPTPEEKRRIRLAKRQARFVAPWPLPAATQPTERATEEAANGTAR